MSLWDAIRSLPLTIERYALESASVEVSTQFSRTTTTVVLQGVGEEGRGEDVTYDGELHEAQAARGATLPLAGAWTLETFSRVLGTLSLWDVEPDQHAYVDYRRWSYESAALDLALRQSGTSLAEVLGRTVEPLTFVVSTRSGFDEWLAVSPGIRFKLDAEADWDDETVARLAATGAIDTVDYKGHYRGTVVDLAPDPALYSRIAEGFPDAFLEDPWLDEHTDPVLAPHRDRITWDAPIHSVADVEALPFAPRVLNCKPSRFGTLERLFAFYDYCAARDIALYGGGQFELGVGRDHIQLLAAMFHPQGPNDVAPSVFNTSAPRPGLPTSPLALRPRATGFGLT